MNNINGHITRGLYSFDKDKLEHKEPDTGFLAICACIYLLEEQKQFIYKTGGSCRVVYNNLLNEYNDARK